MLAATSCVGSGDGCEELVEGLVEGVEEGDAVAPGERLVVVDGDGDVGSPGAMASSCVSTDPPGEQADMTMRRPCELIARPCGVGIPYDDVLYGSFHNRAPLGDRAYM